MKKLPLLFFVIWLFSINAFTQEARPIDAFPIIKCGDFLMRMDNIYLELQENPNSTIYIIYYGGRYRKEVVWNYKTYTIEKIKLHFPHRDDGLKWAKSIPLYLSTAPKYPEEFRNSIKDRITLIDGGYKEDTEVIIWLASKDSELPKPDPTIDEKYIKFKAKKPIGTPIMTDCYSGN